MAVLLFTLPALSFAQQTPKPLQTGKEAPETLLTTSINDVEISLFIRGSWQAELVHSGILQCIPFVYSGVPLLFKQVPEVYLFLALAESLWFEAQIGNDPDKNQFSAGYYKQQDALLLSIRVGNANISMKNQSFSGLGNPASSFGIKADIINTHNLNHAEAMLRWDTTEYETYTYYGYSEATKLSITPAQWLRGKAFILPVQAQIVSLYILDRGQPTLLFPDTYEYNMQTGILVLKNPVTKELRAVIRENAHAYELTLFIPGDANPLELKNVYSLPADTSAQACTVMNKDTNAVDTTFTIRILSGNTIMILRNNAQDPHTNDFAKPFYVDAPWLYDANSTNTASSYVIITNVLEPRENIILSENIIPESITVYRNGLETTSFSYNATTHALTLTPPPLPTDKIIIVCKKYSTARSTGQLVAAAGYMANLTGYSTLTSILSSTFAIPDDFLLVSIEKLYAGIVWTYDRTYESMRTLLAKTVCATQFSLNAPISRPLEDKWKPALSMHTEGSPITITPALALDSFIIPKSNMSTKLLLLTYEKSLSGTSTYKIYDTNIHLENYSTIGLVIKKLSAEPGAALTIEFGTGTNSLRIETIPIGDLPADAWITITVNLITGSVICYDAHGAPLSVPEITVTVPDTRSTVNTVTLKFSTETSTILISEPVSFNPLPTFRITQEGSLTWTEQDQASVTVQEQLYWHTADVNPLLIRGAIQAFWKLNFFETTSSSILVYNGDTILPAFSIAFQLAPSTFPGMLHNNYSYAQEPDRFSQTLNCTLTTRFPITVNGNTTFTDNVSAQTWKLVTGTSEIIAINGEIKQKWIHTVQQFDFFSAYKDSWHTLFTFTDPEVFYRTIKIDMLQKTIGLTMQAKSLYSIYDTYRNSSDFQIDIEPQITLMHGTIHPFIKKTYTIRNATTENSLSSALDTWIATFIDMFNTQCTWEPFFSDMYAQKLTMILERYPEALFSERYGVRLQRPIGYGIQDLFIPALFAVEGYGEYRQHDLRTVQKLGITGTIGAKASNIFSHYGYLPTFMDYTLDEYQWKLTTTAFGFPQLRSAIYYTIHGNIEAYFTGETSISAALTAEFTEAAYGKGFSCSIAGESKIPVQDNSMSWITRLIYMQLPDSSTENPHEKAFVSTWLMKLARAKIQAEDSWRLRAVYTSIPAETSLQLEEYYSAESFMETFLRITFFIKLTETLQWRIDRFLFVVQYSLGLSLKVVF